MIDNDFIIKTEIKYKKPFNKKINKLKDFLKSIDYVIPPLAILPNNYIGVTYKCGHYCEVRIDHLLGGNLCSNKTCKSIRVKKLLKEFYKNETEEHKNKRRLNVSNGTIKGMKNMSKDKKEEMIKNSIQGHIKNNSWKCASETFKENMNHWDFRCRYILKRSISSSKHSSNLEKKFMTILNNMNINYFFQFPLDFYENAGTFFICDFYLLDYDLFINIDGFFHLNEERKERDNLLDMLCANAGFNILHITGDELLDDNFNLLDLLVKYEKKEI